MIFGSPPQFGQCSGWSSTKRLCAASPNSSPDLLQTGHPSVPGYGRVRLIAVSLVSGRSIRRTLNGRSSTLRRIQYDPLPTSTASNRMPQSGRSSGELPLAVARLGSHRDVGRAGPGCGPRPHDGRRYVDQRPRLLSMPIWCSLDGRPAVRGVDCHEMAHA